MDVAWERGSRTVSWGDGRVVKTFEQPPEAVIGRDDPPSVLVIEALTGRADFRGPSNAVVFNEDGSERLRLVPPPLPEITWRAGFYYAFVDQRDRLVVVYSTQTGDLQGTPNLLTGELSNVNTWR